MLQFGAYNSNDSIINYLYKFNGMDFDWHVLAKVKKIVYDMGYELYSMPSSPQYDYYKFYKVDYNRQCASYIVVGENLETHKGVFTEYVDEYESTCKSNEEAEQIKAQIKELESQIDEYVEYIDSYVQYSQAVKANREIQFQIEKLRDLL